MNHEQAIKTLRASFYEAFKSYKRVLDTLYDENLENIQDIDINHLEIRLTTSDEKVQEYLEKTYGVYDSDNYYENGNLVTDCYIPYSEIQELDPD